MDDYKPIEKIFCPFCNSYLDEDGFCANCADARIDWERQGYKEDFDGNVKD